MNPKTLLLLVAIGIIILAIIVALVLRRIARKTEQVQAIHKPGLPVYLKCDKCKCTDFVSAFRDHIIRCYNCKALYFDHGIFGITEFHPPHNANNPYDLQPGDNALLDGDFNNASIVKIIRFTPREIYAAVTDGEEKWEVMTCRLAPPIFYFTFGQAHEIKGMNVKDYWVEIYAHSYELARQKMVELVNDKWSFQYTMEDFKPSYFPGGCIGRYVVTDRVLRTRENVFCGAFQDECIYPACSCTIKKETVNQSLKQ